MGGERPGLERSHSYFAQSVPLLVSQYWCLYRSPHLPPISSLAKRLFCPVWCLGNPRCSVALKQFCPFSFLVMPPSLRHSVTQAVPLWPMAFAPALPPPRVACACARSKRYKIRRCRAIAEPLRRPGLERMREPNGPLSWPMASTVDITP